MPHGRPIRAPLTGFIKDCKWRKAGGRSLWIVSGEWKVYLAPMSSVVMLTGESCRVGDVVGYVGSTGNSTGPHLHLAAMKGYQTRATRYVYMNSLALRIYPPSLCWAKTSL